MAARSTTVVGSDTSPESYSRPDVLPVLSVADERTYCLLSKTMLHGVEQRFRIVVPDTAESRMNSGAGLQPLRTWSRALPLVRLASIGSPTSNLADNSHEDQTHGNIKDGEGGHIKTVKEVATDAQPFDYPTGVNGSPFKGRQSAEYNRASFLPWLPVEKSAKCSISSTKRISFGFIRERSVTKALKPLTRCATCTDRCARARIDESDTDCCMLPSRLMAFQALSAQSCRPIAPPTQYPTPCLGIAWSVRNSG